MCSAAAMAQAVAYSASEEKILDSEQEPEMDGVDPWKAAMQVYPVQLIVEFFPSAYVVWYAHVVFSPWDFHCQVWRFGPHSTVLRWINAFFY